MVTVKLDIHIAWWLRCYIAAIVLMVKLTGMQPNYERIKHWIRKGVTVTARPVDG